jgi:hypothetical protein
VPSLEDIGQARLERDLGRLEGIVESLVRTVQVDHETNAESRRETRKAMDALNDRMEASISAMSREITRFAEASTAADEALMRRQAGTESAWSLSRWLIATGLSIAVLAAAWVGATNDGKDAGQKPAPDSTHHKALRP